MKMLAVIVLGIVMLSAAFVGVASAQSSNGANITPFAVQTNYMSQAGYARYLNYVQTGQWTPVALQSE